MEQMNHRPPCIDGDLCGEAAHCPPVATETHPEHTVVERIGGVTFPAKPVRMSGWRGVKQRRACHKAGGHWWHPEGMIDWYCCRCGAETSGMPDDGSRR